MPVSELIKIAARINWLIGSRGNAFDATVSDDRFIAEEITRAIVESESEIVRDLAESDNAMKNFMMAWSANLTHGQTLPEHLGTVEAVQIQKYAGGTFEPGEKTTRENIRLWRANYNNIFDPLSHTTLGTTLCGYFNLTNQTIEFTGTAAQVRICNYTPNYAALQISDEFDGLLVAGGMSKLLKIGVPTALVNHYANAYQAGRGLIRQGATAVAEINEAQERDD